jgi:hypothetical protein
MTSSVAAAEAQSALLDALGELSDRHGPLLLEPAVEPTPRWFPDPWTPDVAGVERVARRLLDYAGLADLDADVEIWPDRAPGQQRGWGAVASFEGLEAGRARFGLDPALLSDPEGLVAALAHEVAHAWRAARGVRVDDAGVEEQLTDVTCAYLGFGILSANAAYRYQAWLDGRVSWHESSRLGYLAPEDHCHLLALQVMARGATRRERRRIAGLLAPNQAAAFRASWRALRHERAAIHRRLGGPARPGQVRTPLPARRVVPASRATVPNEHRPTGWNRGHQVLRSPRGSRWGYIFGCGVVGFFAGAFVGLVPTAVLQAFFGTGSPPVLAAIVTVPAVGIVLGIRYGLRATRELWDFCSDPGCGAELPPRALECHRCGGTIVGVKPRGHRGDPLTPEDTEIEEELARLALAASPEPEPEPEHDAAQGAWRGLRR